MIQAKGRGRYSWHRQRPLHDQPSVWGPSKWLTISAARILRMVGSPHRVCVVGHICDTHGGTTREGARRARKSPRATRLGINNEADFRSGRGRNCGVARGRTCAAGGATAGVTGRDRGVEHGHHPEARLLSTPSESAESAHVEAPPLRTELHEALEGCFHWRTACKQIFKRIASGHLRPTRWIFAWTS
jgi:hypothetical protein